MPDVTPPKYPAALTVSSWNKAKGVLARITKVKTGITEELEAAKKAFDAAPFKDLNTSKLVLGKDLSLKDLKQIQDDYLRKYHPQFKKLELTFYDLSQTLKKKAAMFEADEKTKKFAAAVKLMAEEANKFTYMVAWGTVSSDNQRYLQDQITSQEKNEKMWAEAEKKLKLIIDKASKSITAYKSKTPTAIAYRSFWSEDLRGIGAQIAMASRNNPQIKEKFAAPFKVAAKQWMDSALPTKDDQVADQIKKDIELLKKFKAISDTL